MSKGHFEVPKDSLASLDQFGNRRYVYPAFIDGVWQKRRTIVQWVLLAIFLALPWIHWNGQPLVLLNLPERRFILFGLTFWAHDAPMIFFVLAIAALSLTLVTAIWGRVWCGWACPQTVFIEQVFRRIERWIEGTHLQRRQLDQADLSLSKVAKKSSKWFLFFVLSWIIGNSFLMYFVGTDRWLGMIQTPPSHNWTSFLVMAFVTGVVLFDFGWFREQFCIIMCPYGRIQSVLMDKNSMTVAYDVQRGEPRKGSQSAAQKVGDCVDCFRCVAVCPTGIDIRHGTQMECIACTACIDACDEVMTKVKKPTGLIKYEKSGSSLRFRTTLYGGVLFLLLIGFTIFMSQRQDVTLNLLRAIEMPYQTHNDESGHPWIVNRYQLLIENHRFHDVQVKVDFPNENVKVIAPLESQKIAPNVVTRQPVFFEVPAERLGSAGRLDLTARIQIIEDSKTSERFEKVRLIGPTNH